MALARIRAIAHDSKFASLVKQVDYVTWAEKVGETVVAAEMQVLEVYSWRRMATKTRRLSEKLSI